MHTQRQLLEMARERHGLNYSQLADRLGMHRQHMSQFKLGQPLPAERAIALAGLCELSPAYVLACVEYQRAERLEDTVTLPVWREIAGKFAAVVVVATVAGFLMCGNTAHSSACAAFFSGQCIPYAKYAMRKLLKKLRSASRLLGAMAIIAAPAAAHANGWTPLTIGEESAFQISNLLDWGTTSDISRANRPYSLCMATPGTQICHFYFEHDSAWAIGAHPTQARINEYMAAGAALHFAVSSLLINHPKAEQVWQVITIGETAATVGHNFSIGLHFAF